MRRGIPTTPSMEGYTSFLVAAFGVAVFAWATIGVATVVGRLGYERRQRAGRLQVAVSTTGGRSRRLVARAARHRGEAGKWRRIAALRALARSRHPAARWSLRRALADSDRDVAGAAVRALGDVADDWAVDLLVQALRENRSSRALAAAQLERRPAELDGFLASMVTDPDPAVRFWGATLLAARPDSAHDALLALARDDDPNVRAAATESLGVTGQRGALAAVKERLDDEAWFVRVHACRALGELGSPADAPTLAAMLGDTWWWVRAAAKDALRGLGISVAGALIPHLESGDGFVRNGAAEVLQDIGFLDALARTGPEGALRERILAAGGEDMRQTADSRAADSEGDTLDTRAGA